MNYLALEKKRESDINVMNSSSKKRRRIRTLSYGGDNHILLRIKELMEVSKASPCFDEDKLLSDLQDIYPEYRRKKRRDLRLVVRKAIELFSLDGGSSNGDGSGQSFVNNAESSPDVRCVAYEDARFPKKIKLNESKEYHLETETVNTPKLHAVGRNTECLKNSAQGSVVQCSEIQKSQKIPRSLKKQESEGPIPQHPTVTFSDIGGQRSTLLKLLKLLKRFKFPKLHALGRDRKPRGILLHGPPGCGKTLLAHAIAGEMHFPLIEVAATDLISGISGESEVKIRNLFEQAVNCSPCVLFIDEIDIIAAKKESASRGMEKRIVCQLLKSMDALRMRYVSSQVLVIGATNTPDVLDPAFRRGGRFGREIAIGIPDEAARISILKVVCKDLRLSPDFDYYWLASRTPGYVGADLAELVEDTLDEACDRIFDRLCLIFESDSKMQNELLRFVKEAGLKVNCIAEVPKAFLSTETAEIIKIRAMFSMSSDEVNSTIEKLMEELYIDVRDFQASLDTYVPSLKREGFATVSSVPWSRIGGLKQVQEELQQAILWPIKHKEACDRVDYHPPAGVLLWGPKGCGKTLLAKAVASECNINFISVKGPELMNMYVGESESAVRKVFRRARNSAPCVVLLDELDCLCPPRSKSHGDRSTDRVVGQLLTEIDGAGPKSHIFIIGTTNRLENIDCAMLRPGRLEMSLYVGLPTPEERVEILIALTKNDKNRKYAGDVDLEALGLDRRCDGFSGADLQSLLRTAALGALRDYISENADDSCLNRCVVTQAHFDLAFNKITPSVSKKERKYFEMLKLSKEKG